MEVGAVPTELLTPLRLPLDNPGVDFVILDGSVIVEEKSARPTPSIRAGFSYFGTVSRNRVQGRG